MVGAVIRIHLPDANVAIGTFVSYCFVVGGVGVGVLVVVGVGVVVVLALVVFWDWEDDDLYLLR